MATVTKDKLCEELCFSLGFNKREAVELVDGIFSELKGVLSQGTDVKVSGFGNFVLRDKAERPGRNPKTGEVIPVKARKVVTFRPGQKLKSQVEQYVGPEMQLFSQTADESATEQE